MKLSNALKALILNTLVFVLTGCTHGERFKKVIPHLQVRLQSGFELQHGAYKPVSGSDDDTIKSEILKRFQELSKVKVIELSDFDKILRPIGVGMQTIIEQTLLKLIEERTVTRVMVLFHTKAPATPLVSPENTAPPEAMSIHMQGDSARAKTISDRTVTVRNLAKSDPEKVTLYIAYPESGMQIRDTKQQAIYQKEMANEQNKCLKDLPLSHQSMPDNLVGASYIMTGTDADEDSQPLYFGLRAVQAIDGGKKNMTWTFWLGELNDAEIQPHYQEVKTYLQSGVPTDLDLKLP
ncbi:hypothetical protein [Endozoicomonas sp. GU-1]|nr:hypothetical protein [Endozoicomonas sp. GU-1]WBA80573.1 hypothetical protein O2T12_19960 [Endozoicomonas sp. GU-1]